MGDAAEVPSTIQALWRIPKWFPDLSSQAIETLKSFHVELLHFNAKVNLIGRGTERDADEAHFADSILGGRLLLKNCQSKVIYDIGSGNGLPGVALAIMDPSREIRLIDRDARKSEFLKQIVFRLKLKNVTVTNASFEDIAPGTIDAAVSRGFGTITRTLLAGNRAFHKDSVYYHFKTNTWSTEVASIPSQLCAVWIPELVGDYSLPDTQARRAVVLTRKIGN